MKKVWLFLLLSFLKVSYGQTDSARSATSGAIEYSSGGFFHPGRYSINGQQQSFKEIKTILSNNKTSSEEFNQAKKYNRLTLYMFTAAIACLVSSYAANGNSTTWRTPGVVVFGVGGGFIIPEAIFAGKRNKHFRHSVKLYNQQYQ